MIEHSYATGHGDTIADMLTELEGQVFEHAARICENMIEHGVMPSRIAIQFANAVRDRRAPGT